MWRSEHQENHWKNCLAVVDEIDDAILVVQRDNIQKVKEEPD